MFIRYKIKDRAFQYLRELEMQPYLRPGNNRRSKEKCFVPSQERDVKPKDQLQALTKKINLHFLKMKILSKGKKEPTDIWVIRTW